MRDARREEEDISGHNPRMGQTGIQLKEHSVSPCSNVKSTGKMEITEQWHPQGRIYRDMRHNRNTIVSGDFKSPPFAYGRSRKQNKKYREELTTEWIIIY